MIHTTGREKPSMGSSPAASASSGTVECHGSTAGQWALQVAGHQSEHPSSSEYLVATQCLYSSFALCCICESRSCHQFHAQLAKSVLLQGPLLTILRSCFWQCLCSASFLGTTCNNAFVWSLLAACNSMQDLNSGYQP